MVVAATVEQRREVAGDADVGHDRVLESADRGLEGVARVEEHDVLTPAFDELVDVVRAEPNTAADDAASSTANSSLAPKETISSRTRTRRRGKSRADPSDHLKSIVRNPGNSRVAAT